VYHFRDGSTLIQNEYSPPKNETKTKDSYQHGQVTQQPTSNQSTRKKQHSKGILNQMHANQRIKTPVIIRAHY